MFELKLIFFFSLYEFISSLNNNTSDNSSNYINTIQIIQNTPVENNIPLMIHEVDKNYIYPNIDNNNNINSPIYIPNAQQEEVITNTSIKINTTNKDPMCTRECCMGCQIQFNKLISQKNCIINICKCQIIEITQKEIDIIKDKLNSTKDKEIKKENSFIILNFMHNNLNISDMNEKNSSYFYYCFILLIFLFYESYILFNLNQKDNKFIMIKDKNNNNLVFEKDKEKRINEYMEILYGEEELIENLI